MGTGGLPRQQVCQSQSKQPQAPSGQELSTEQGLVLASTGGAEASIHLSSGLATSILPFFSPCLSSRCFPHQKILSFHLDSSHLPRLAFADLSIHSSVCRFMHLFLSHSVFSMYSVPSTTLVLGTQR